MAGRRNMIGAPGKSHSVAGVPCRAPFRILTMNDSPVAVIGLGLMGEVYARRLLDARIPVIGYDIDPSKRDPLAAIGGRSVDSIAELAKPARCIIIAVFNTDEVEDVIEQHLWPPLGGGSKKNALF